MTDDCCTDFWHELLTSPPQTYTAEQVREHFKKEKESEGLLPQARHEASLRDVDW